MKSKMLFAAISLSSLAAAGCSQETETIGSISSASGGAAYSTFDDAQGGCLNSNNGVNCNHYENRGDVYANGGPERATLANGSYFFAVVTPGNQNNGFIDGANGNLSDAHQGSTAGDYGSGDSVANRTFSVRDGVITYTGTHHLGTSPNGKRIIQVGPFDETDNNGGVHILAICEVGATKSNKCKFDAFKIDACGDGSSGGMIPYLVTSACPSSEGNPSILRRVERDNSITTIGTVNVAGTPVIVNALGSDLTNPDYAYALSTVTTRGFEALEAPTFYKVNLVTAEATALGTVEPPPAPSVPSSALHEFGVSFVVSWAADGVGGSKYFLTGVSAIAHVVSVSPFVAQLRSPQLYLGEISLRPQPSTNPTWRLVDTSDPATTAIIEAFTAEANDFLTDTEGALPAGGFQDIVYVPQTGNIITYLGIDNKFLTVTNVNSSPVAVTTTPSTLLPVDARNTEVGSMFRNEDSEFYAYVADTGIAYRIDPMTGNYLGSSIDTGVGCSRGDATIVPTR